MKIRVNNYKRVPGRNGNEKKTSFSLTCMRNGSDHGCRLRQQNGGAG